MEILSRSAVLEYVAPLVRSIFRFVPGGRQRMRAIELSRRIDELDAAGRFEESRPLRSAGLRELPVSCQAPLWRSEAEDLLRRGNAEQALAAFERAIDYAEQSPFFYGIAAPHRIYYGAAVAAADSGRRDRALAYAKEFENLIVAFRADPQLAAWVASHEKQFEYLHAKLRTV